MANANAKPANATPKAPKAKAPATPKASNTAPAGTSKPQAPALAGRLLGLPAGLPAGNFVAVLQLANPKAQGSGAYNRYAALLALVAKHGNGKFTVAQWAAVVGRASDLRYNTHNCGKGNGGKPYVATFATQAAALAALAPKAKAPKATPAPAPAAPAPAAQG